jgi:hypothetical protein
MAGEELFYRVEADEKPDGDRRTYHGPRYCYEEQEYRQECEAQLDHFERSIPLERGRSQLARATVRRRGGACHQSQMAFESRIAESASLAIIVNFESLTSARSFFLLGIAAA